MEYVIKFGCPFVFTQPWQVWAFLALPSLLAAFGALICQGSFLRILGATFGSVLRDGALLLMVGNGFLVPTNPSYDVYAGSILLFCVASGSALGAVFGPYTGFRLMILAALGALAGQWAYGYLPLVLVLALALQVRARYRRCALPAA